MTDEMNIVPQEEYTEVVDIQFRPGQKVYFFDPAGLKLTAGKGRLTASWKKSPGDVDGYQLQYGLKKNFRGAKKVTVRKAATLKKVLKNLKKGKIYYVRIRAWKKNSGYTYWSAWSGAKKAKVK